jgi:hypothetical protein
MYAAALAEASFVDATKAWAKESIESLAARGIVSGKGDGRFQPEDNVTRAEFITMLMNALELTEDDATTDFSDVQAGAWYYDEVAAAQQLGIIKGRPDGSFGIQDEITRQDMVVMAYQAMTYAGLKLDKGIPTTFKDAATISSYALEGVTAMHTAGMINGMGNGQFKPASKATRAQAAVIIYKILNVL